MNFRTSLIVSLFFFSSVVIFLPVFCEKKMSLPENYLELMDDDQDMPSINVDNPLKGFKSYVFMPAYPKTSETQDLAIQKLIEKELQLYGTVKKTEISINTKSGNVIDLSVFNKGPLLTYKIQNIISLDGTVLPFVRASLNLRTNLTVDKTESHYSGYIWSRSSFLSGNADKNLEKMLSKTLERLLKIFMRNYTLVNDEKPVFYLVYP